MTRAWSAWLAIVCLVTARVAPAAAQPFIEKRVGLVSGIGDYRDPLLGKLDHQLARNSGSGTRCRSLVSAKTGRRSLRQRSLPTARLLEEDTRERVPLSWTAAQIGLGYALMSLGQRGTGTDELEQAVAAFREALKEETRERMPLGWAIIQTDLGTALMSLGHRQARTDRLEEAVAAFREALKEETRERLPLAWGAIRTISVTRSLPLVAVRPAPPGSGRQSRPFAKPSRKIPASVCPSFGPPRRIISATPSRSSASGRQAQTDSRKLSTRSARRLMNTRTSRRRYFRPGTQATRALR
jgi:hypothetical protein